MGGRTSSSGVDGDILGEQLVEHGAGLTSLQIEHKIVVHLVLIHVHQRLHQQYHPESDDADDAGDAEGTDDTVTSDT